MNKNIFKSDFIDYTNKVYYNFWSEKYPGNGNVNLFVDKVDENLESNINEIFSNFFNDLEDIELSKLNNSLDSLDLRQSLSKKAYYCSNELGTILPFLGYANFYEFKKNKEDVILRQKEKYSFENSNLLLLWSYYLDNFSQTQNLSELFDRKIVSCNEQSFLIKQSLELNGFKAYNPMVQDYSSQGIIPKPRVHTFLAFKMGDYYLKIDPTIDSELNRPDSFLQYYVGFEKKNREIKLH